MLVEAVNVHPAKPVDGFVLNGVTGTAKRGIRLVNLRNVELKDINVTIAEGLILATSNVTGRGLAGAVPAIPRRDQPMWWRPNRPIAMARPAGDPTSRGKPAPSCRV